MRVNISWFWALLLTLLPFSLAQAMEWKLGYVNMERLYAEAPQVESASKKLSQEFSAKQDKLAGQQKEIKRAEEQLVREGDVMSPSQRRDQEQSLQNMKREFRRMQEDLRDDFNVRRNEVMAKFQEQVQRVVDAVGAEGGYDFIFYEGVAYNNSRVDITDKVLEHLRAPAAKSAAPEGKATGAK